MEIANRRVYNAISIVGKSEFEALDVGRLVKVARLEQLRLNHGLTVEVEGHPIALFLHEGRVYALDDRCPHAGGPLGAGYCQGGLVMCPWLGWRFDVTSGAWADAPQAGIKVPTFPVQLKDQDIYVEI